MPKIKNATKKSVVHWVNGKAPKSAATRQAKKHTNTPIRKKATEAKTQFEKSKSTSVIKVNKTVVLQKTGQNVEPQKAIVLDKVDNTLQTKINSNIPEIDSGIKQILTVEKLNKFFVKSGKLVQVLDDIDFHVNEKDFFGIIGESGSGKSTTGKCIIRLYSSSSGIVTFDNRIINQSSLSFSQKIGQAFNRSAAPIDEISSMLRKYKIGVRTKTTLEKHKTWLYNNMSMIFQDPMSSLNPRKNVLSLVAEPLVINKTIKNDVRALLDKYAETNPYFQNTYQNQDNVLVKKYLLPFYEQNITLFTNMTNVINAIPNELKHTVDLLDAIADLETEFKGSLHYMNAFVNEIKQLVHINNQKLLSGKVHATETLYYNAEKKLKQETRNLEVSAKYSILEKQLESQHAALSDYIQRQKAVYEFQNLPRFRSILNSLKSETKSLRQDARLTNSITDHLFKKTDIYIKNDTYHALKEVIATYGAGINAYFELDEMEKFYDFIVERIKSKYAAISKDTSRLVTLSEKIDAIKDNEIQNPDVVAILNEYHSLYERISSELEVLKRTNFIEADNTVKKAINDIVNRSFEIKQNITKEIERQQLEAIAIIKQMEDAKAKHEEHQSKTSDAYQSALKNFEQATKERQIYVDADNLEFNTNILPVINQQLQLVKQLDNQLYNIHRKFVATVHHKQKQFVKLLKQNPDHNPEKAFKETLERWMKVFSDEEKAKRSTIDILTRNIKNSLVGIAAVNFEITTNLDTIALCRKLRTKNKAILLSCMHALSTLITRDYVYSALDEVGLKNEHAYRYPHEFSGGQRQRIVIARALISKPKLIIADEPISALDVSIQAQVINIMKNLAKKHNITFIFIAHDLSMVKYVSNRLIIMHKGKIVEKGYTDEIFRNPVHPYTKSLIKASPELSKIHVDLAAFSAKLDYDKNYSVNNRPAFFSVSDKFEHFVFATQEQIKKWKK